MTGRRKGTPCACETDPCSCGSSKGKCIRTINNLSPDPNGDFFIEAGSGITITQTSDNGFEVSFDGTLPSNPVIYKGTVGSGGTVAVLPAADPDNIGWCYIAIEAATTPVTYEVGDVLISDGYTWQVVPSGDEIINIVTSWQATPDDQHVPSEKLVKDSLDGKVDKLITPIVGVYAHTSATQNEIRASINAGAGTVMLRNSAGRSNVKDVSADTDSDEIINVRTLNRRLTDGSVSQIGTSNVGTDTKPIKLVGGVPTLVTNDLVDLPSVQAITGAKTVPLEATGTFSDQIASSNKVKNELDNYAPMVRTTGNQTISGVKSFTSILAEYFSVIENHFQDSGVTTQYRQLYTVDMTGGAQYHHVFINLAQRRSNDNTGILKVTINRNANGDLVWIAGNQIDVTKFVITKETNNIFTIWYRSGSASADGIESDILFEIGGNGPNQRIRIPTDTNWYEITSSGYTDIDSVVHSFLSYYDSTIGSMTP